MKRPFGVLVLGVVVLLGGLVLTALAAFALFVEVAALTGHLPSDWQISPTFQAQDVFWVTAQLALGLAALVSGIGLLLRRAWAWLLALALLGCELVIQLSNYFQGRPTYWAMLLTALLVLYLNQRPIREAFHMAHQQLPLSSSALIETAGDDGLAETLVAGTNHH